MTARIVRSRVFCRSFVRPHLLKYFDSTYGLRDILRSQKAFINAYVQLDYRPYHALRAGLAGGHFLTLK